MKHRDAAKDLRHRVIFSFVSALAGGLRALPRRPAILLMKKIGWLSFYLARSRRLRTLRQLRMAFGREKSAAEIHRLARRVFMNFGILAADAIRIPKILENGIERLIKVEGIERLDRLSRGNQGAILLTAHFGNWELLAAWMAKKGYKLKAVASPGKNRRLNALIVESRNRAGFASISRGSDTREILRAIAHKYFIGMLIDVDTRVEGVFVKFFGQWAHTPVGPVRLAEKYGLNILPIFMRLTPQYAYHIEVKEPLPLVWTGDKTRDLLVNTQMCSDAYERIIRRYPDQWLWMMKRWKRQPDGRSLGLY